MRRSFIAPLPLLALLACDDAIQDPGDGGQFGEETGSGCEVVGETPLALDEASALGFAPQDLLDLAEGEHALDLTWSDGSTSPLALGVADPSDARLLDYEYVSDGSGAEPAFDCADVLAIDVQLTLVTDDGGLAEDMAVVLQRSEGEETRIRADLDAIAGSLDPWDHAPEAFDEVWADVEIEFAAAGPAGIVSGYGETTSGTGDEATVSMMRFDIATF